jgi:hypothetical protein
MLASLQAAGGGKQLLQRPWTAYCLQDSDPMSGSKCGRW